MILTCPACATRYLTDPIAIGPSGRTVRCAKCGHAWRQDPPAEPAPRLDVISPSLDTPAYRPAPGAGLPARIEPRRERRAGGGLMLAATIVLVVLAGLYLGRERVAAAWPDSAQLYALVGLDVEVLGAGLSFSDVTLTRQPVNGRDTVLVEGRVRNDSGAARPVPALLASLRDAAGRTLRSWTVKIEPQTLQPGEAAAFRTSMIDPPEDAERVSITFARATGG